METTMKLASLTLVSAATAALAAQAEMPAPPQEPVTYETAPAACAVEEFTIYFERGITQLGDQADAVLDAVAADSAHCEYFRIEVAGHADATGPEELNQQVSKDRAEAVMAALEDRRISAEQIGIMPKGQARAYAANGLVEPLNRKATIRLVPVSGTSQDS
jgi:outer membrane protein OmpA-like peptidoglycan-associated protein